MDETIESLKKQKDAAYAERNKLVCVLARIAASSYEPNHRAWIGRYPDNDDNWEKDWMHIVFVELPTGQLSWHIHDSELPMFAFLLSQANLKKSPEEGWPAYDGHTTEQKYERLLWWRP